MFALLGSSQQANPLEISWQTVKHVLPACVKHSVQPSVWDLLAAPTVFLQQALVYRTDLDVRVLESSLQSVVSLYPAFAARLVATDKDGSLSLFSSSTAGVAFMEGTAATLTLQQLLPPNAAAASSALPNQQPSLSAAAAAAEAAGGFVPLVVPELPDALFGHLPGALTPSYADNPDLALTHIALLHLKGGGCVLGVRTSHLIGDWSSLRLLLHSIAAAYSQIMQQQHQQLAGTSSAICTLMESAQLAAAGAEGAVAAGATPQTNSNSSSNSSSRDGNSSDDSTPAGVQLAPLFPAAPLLNCLVLAARQQQPDSFAPVRLKLLEPKDEAMFQQLAALSSSSCDGGSSSGGSEGSGVGSGQPQRLTYHALPAFIQHLKALAGSTSNSSSRVYTAHNVLLARMLQAFASLPGRAGVPHDVAVSVDMRGKLPAKQLRHLLPQQQQQLAMSVGNFFASAIVEGCVAEQWRLGQLAQQVHAAVQRSCELWLPDLAWASGIMGLTAATLSGPSSEPAQPDNQAGPATGKDGSGAAAAADAIHVDSQQQQDGEQQNKQQHVTWRRLHAMGPRQLLEKQVALGLLASLSTTQWPLNFQTDAAMAGEEPALAVPSFSQPQPFPLLLMQQAPEAAGGGVLLHVWLDGTEVELMRKAVAALGEA